MASTEEILEAAAKLGQMITGHPAAKKLEDVVRRLEADTEAQRAMSDYNRHMQKLAEKESQGKPIEVEDKRQLDKLQTVVMKNAVLRDFQMAQMDYADLMRKVDAALYGDGSPTEGAHPTAAGGVSHGAPIINPDVIRGAKA